MLEYKECMELISELKEDIAEFGENEVVCVWCRNDDGIAMYINYDFITKEKPITSDELDAGEYLKTMTMGDLLKALEEQSEIL